MTASVLPLLAPDACQRFPAEPSLAPLKTFTCRLIDGFSLTAAEAVLSTRTLGDACDQAVDLVKASPDALGFDLWFGGRRIVCLRPGGPAACVINITDDPAVTAL
jgi:hypothetical protein